MIKINLWARGSGRNPRAVFLFLWLCLTIFNEWKTAQHMFASDLTTLSCINAAIEAAVISKQSPKVSWSFPRFAFFKIITNETCLSWYHFMRASTSYSFIPSLKLCVAWKRAKIDLATWMATTKKVYMPTALSRNSQHKPIVILNWVPSHLHAR